MRPTPGALRPWLPAVGLLVFGSCAVAVPQGPAVRDLLSQPPGVWAAVAAANQEVILRAGHDIPLRYRERRINAKGDTTREVIESRDGAVARTVERNGAPLSAAENEAERQRLEDLLHSPDAFLNHHRHDHAGSEYALELIHALPGAMRWSYAPGQPQLNAGSGPPSAPQIVLDFTPDPHFTPPTLITEGLTGIAGRVWIDANTRCVLRIQGRILHPVDFGWGGMLARVREGGTVELDQVPAAPHRWMYSHLKEDITVREVLVHTVSEHSQSSAWDAHPLPAPLSYQQAIQELLSLPVAVR